MVKALDSSVHPLCSDTVRSPRSVLSTFLFHKRNSLGDRTPCSDCLESDLAVGDPCLQQVSVLVHLGGRGFDSHF